MRAKSAKSKPTKEVKRVPTPWLKLKKMWERGATYEQMAKATDAHYDPKKHDPTKPTRAKISKARNEGVRIGGKLVKFGERGNSKQRSDNRTRKVFKQAKSRRPEMPKPSPPNAPESQEPSLC